MPSHTDSTPQPGQWTVTYTDLGGGGGPVMREVTTAGHISDRRA